MGFASMNKTGAYILNECTWLQFLSNWKVCNCNATKYHAYWIQNIYIVLLLGAEEAWFGTFNNKMKAWELKRKMVNKFHLRFWNSLHFNDANGLITIRAQNCPYSKYLCNWLRKARRTTTIEIHNSIPCITFQVDVF